jgi:hypothetical protein
MGSASSWLERPLYGAVEIGDLPMTNHPRFLSTTGGEILQFLVPVLMIGMIATIPAKAVDLDELTVVTLARDGAWGVATAGSQGQAIAAAIRDCRAVAAAPNDCGAQFITTRDSWVVANLCGDHKIIADAETREAAEQAAFSRETEVRRLYVPDMPPCRRILTIEPRGVVLPNQPTPAHQIGARR